MNAASLSIAYGSQTIDVRVMRRERKTMAISVLPDMSVEVVAPKRTTDAAIRERVRKRASWILRQIRFFRQFHPKTPERKFLPGETHLYLGRRYRLRAAKAESASVRIRGNFIEVLGPRADLPDEVATAVSEWSKRQARKMFEERLAACLRHFRNADRVAPKALIVRRLRQRWGSMSAGGRLVLNRSLIQAAVPEIDYVITHELCHRIHHHHGPQFFELLDRMMPDWETRKASLERRLA